MIGISLSPAGIEAMDLLRAASQAGEDAIAAKIGPEGYAALHELLRRIG